MEPSSTADFIIQPSIRQTQTLYLFRFEHARLTASQKNETVDPREKKNKFRISKRVKMKSLCSQVGIVCQRIVEIHEHDMQTNMTWSCSQEPFENCIWIFLQVRDRWDSTFRQTSLNIITKIAQMLAHTHTHHLKITTNIHIQYSHKQI